MKKLICFAFLFLPSLGFCINFYSGGSGVLGTYWNPPMQDWLGMVMTSAHTVNFPSMIHLYNSRDFAVDATANMVFCDNYGNYMWGMHVNLDTLADNSKGYVVGAHGPNTIAHFIDVDGVNALGMKMFHNAAAAPSGGLIQIRTEEDWSAGPGVGSFTGGIYMGLYKNNNPELYLQEGGHITTIGVVTSSKTVVSELAGSAAPSAGTGVFYAKSADSLPYYKDDGGTEHGLVSATEVYSWSITTPAVQGYVGQRIPKNSTLSRIDCYVTAATSVALNVEERATIGSAGTNAMSSELTCTTAGASQTSFADSAWAAGNWLWLDNSAVTGTPGQLIVTVTYTHVE